MRLKDRHGSNLMQVITIKFIEIMNSVVILKIKIGIKYLTLVINASIVAKIVAINNHKLHNAFYNICAMIAKIVITEMSMENATTI